jgi:effector-binding domain-containing protein
MTSEPSIEQRDAWHYAAIRVQVTMQEMVGALPQLWPEIHRWLDAQGAAPAGAPFIRYLDIDPAMQHLNIDVGIPVAGSVAGEGRIQTGTMPAGSYASLIHTGPFDGLAAANAELQAWSQANGAELDNEPSEDGTAWGGRFEFYLTDPGSQPDPSKWQTEVALLLRSR